MPENFPTLILAATIAQEEAIRQLLLYFDRVFLYSPTEEVKSLLPPAFATLCLHQAPAPLGDGLAGFRQLLSDMTRHRSEYYGGGLSKISQATQVDEESVWRLISRLAPQTATPGPEGAMMQARLLLALAEVRDQEEREIEETLTRIAGQGHSLLQGLTHEGDDEDEEELALLLADHDRSQASDTLEKRLWAWAHLFLTDPRRTEHWLVTTTPEVMAILAEITTTRIDESPHRLLSLPLAGNAIMAPTAEAYLQERAAWRQTAAPCLTALAAALKGAARSGSTGPLDSLQAEWNSCRRGSLPWGEQAGAALDLYLLPLSLPDLMAKLAKRPAPVSDAAPLPHAVVAVLNL